MSFSDTVFLFFLALILFGPKKLPEMARQAGRLLAELRRASNEFRSQIETEIAHLEVATSQTATPSAPPPQGTVASLSLNPAASEATPHESRDTLAGPAADATPQVGNAAVANPVAANPAAGNPVTPSSSELPADPVADPSATTSQESHV